MVVVGGETRVRGVKNDDSPWSIAIEKPDPNTIGDYDRLAQLSTGALASSGDYRNFFVVDGVTYSHTIDPKTGKPVTHHLASASVLASDCMTADAFATAALVLGKEDAANLLDDLGMQYHLITREGAKLSHETSDGLALVEVPKNNSKPQSRGFLPVSYTHLTLPTIYSV